jgi:hypothetical protein
MTNKKPVSRKRVPATQSTKLDAATLRNMAHQTALPAADNDVDSAALQPIAEMLAKLSPSNLHLVENIIRVIVEDQTRDDN